MAKKHDQRPDKSFTVCVSCQKNNCQNCIDILRAVYTDKKICSCERRGHTGDPIEKQIKDPYTSDVYGPHSVIKEDGTIVSDEEFKQMWREQFGD